MSNQSNSGTRNSKGAAHAIHQDAPGATGHIGVAAFITKAQQMGVQVDPITMIHFYVALKSKPLAILVGPRSQGKIALVESLAQVLVDEDPVRFQRMNGHAWWASGNQNVGFFTQAQTVFNTTKLLTLIDEAWQPENRPKTYLACLTRISPAELLDYFAALALQLQHRTLTRIPGAQLTAQFPFPPNLRLIGTMDVPRFDWYDRALLAHTSVLFWPKHTKLDPLKSPQPPYVPPAENAQLGAWVWHSSTARLILKKLFRWPSQIVQPLVELLSRLEKAGLFFPSSVLNEALIYLANSWSADGHGLFAAAHEENLKIALDLATTHTILPLCLRAFLQLEVQPGLVADLLQPRFPRTLELLTQWTKSNSNSLAANET